VVVVLLLLAGCTTTGGQAEPAPPTSAAPTRPRDVRIDGVDPCSLLTEQQRAELGLDAQPRRDVGPLPPYPGNDIPLCLFGGFRPRSVSLGVAVVTTTGIDLFLSGGLVVDARPIEVSGFPALIAIAPRNTDFCTVVVDVAPGQTLDVNFRLDGRNAGASLESLCQDAERAAGAAMDTLLTVR
jgi:Protein of unknown function (DUF3558)